MNSLHDTILRSFGVDLPISGGDGSSFDNAIRIKINDSSGISIEYAVLRYLHFISHQKWQVDRSSLRHHNGRSYDILSVVRDDNHDCLFDYYFDISKFYGTSEEETDEQVTPLNLSELVSLYAKAWNQLDFSVLEPYLAPEIVYESQHVFNALEGKVAVSEHLRGKMNTLRQKGDSRRAFAELSFIPYGSGKGEPCVLLAQGSKENIVVLVILQSKEGKITRIDICGLVPDPKTAKRTGIYPGLED